MRIHNKQLTQRAKDLRKNLTNEERKLWYEFLRNYPVKFLRQKVIGNYIVDFYCAKAKLVVELDGSQHFEEVALRYDQHRSEFLEQFGIRIVRVINRDINENFRAVCLYIDTLVKERLFTQCNNLL